MYWDIKPTYGERLDFAWLADDHATGIQTPVFMGMLVEAMNGEDLARHIERARMSSAEGVSVFSYTGLDGAGLWQALRDWAFYLPARRVE